MFYFFGFKMGALVGKTPEYPDDDLVGIDNVTFYHFHSNETIHTGYIDKYLDGKNGKIKTVITLQDPNRWLCSIADRPVYPITHYNNWMIMMDQTTNTDNVYIDILCPPEKRVTHITSVLKQLGIYKSEYDPLIINWCSNHWKKYNSVGGHNHQNYEETGTLPRGLLSPYNDQNPGNQEQMMNILRDWYKEKRDPLINANYEVI
jgi:hypothetical protein